MPTASMPAIDDTVLSKCSLRRMAAEASKTINSTDPDGQRAGLPYYFLGDDAERIMAVPEGGRRIILLYAKPLPITEMKPLAATLKKAGITKFVPITPEGLQWLATWHKAPAQLCLLNHPIWLVKGHEA